MISKVARPAGGETPAMSETSARSVRADARPPADRSSFAEVLSRLGGEIDRGERLVGRAVSGSPRSLAAGDLIALQAGIYRYTEAVDLSAKIVDRATSAVKTTLGSGNG